MPELLPERVSPAVVRHFIRGLGFDPLAVREVLIAGDHVEVEMYERDDDGRVTLRLDHEPVTRVVTLAVV